MRHTGSSPTARFNSRASIAMLIVPSPLSGAAWARDAAGIAAPARGASAAFSARHDGLRLAEQVHVGGRQPLVLHAPAVVHELIDRDLDDLGGHGRGAPRLLQRAAQVEPVEAQHDIRFAQHGG